MATIKEYAESRNISYESARKAVRRYEDALKGHTRMDGRTLIIDDDGVKILDAKRRSSPSVVAVIEEREELIRLRAENVSLLTKLTEVQEMLIVEKDKVQRLQEEKLILLEERNRGSDPGGDGIRDSDGSGDGVRDSDLIGDTVEETADTGRRWWQFWKRRKK